jgi:hypothetical protein
MEIQRRTLHTSHKPFLQQNSTVEKNSKEKRC